MEPAPGLFAQLPPPQTATGANQTLFQAGDNIEESRLTKRTSPDWPSEPDTPKPRRGGWAKTIEISSNLLANVD